MKKIISTKEPIVIEDVKNIPFTSRLKILLHVRDVIHRKEIYSAL